MTKLTIFLNMRTAQGVETVDEFSPEENQTPREFRKYVNDMAREYHLSGQNVYQSSRCTKDWRDRP